MKAPFVARRRGSNGRERTCRVICAKLERRLFSQCRTRGADVRSAAPTSGSAASSSWRNRRSLRNSGSLRELIRSRYSENPDARNRCAPGVATATRPDADDLSSIVRDLRTDWATIYSKRSRRAASINSDGLAVRTFRRGPRRRLIGAGGRIARECASRAAVQCTPRALRIANRIGLRVGPSVARHPPGIVRSSSDLFFIWPYTKKSRAHRFDSAITNWRRENLYAPRLPPIIARGSHRAIRSPLRRGRSTRPFVWPLS